MLLRSIVHHVCEQDWLVVVIDFTIVVIGVLIAIRVASWNVQVRERQQESLILSRPREDFAAPDIDVAEALATHHRKLCGLPAVIEALDRSDSLPPTALAANCSRGRRVWNELGRPGGAPVEIRSG